MKFINNASKNRIPEVYRIMSKLGNRARTQILIILWIRKPGFLRELFNYITIIIIKLSSPCYSAFRYLSIYTEACPAFFHLGQIMFLGGVDIFSSRAELCSTAKLFNIKSFTFVHSSEMKAYSARP